MTTISVPRAGALARLRATRFRIRPLLGAAHYARGEMR
jgi:hypothetical protein